jgi:hypothetical protein
MRRRIGFLFICSAVVPIAIFASTAWGCGALTTLSSAQKVAAPGSTISLSGRNFGATPANTPVEIRWNSRTGQKLNTTDINPVSGAFTANVQVPADASPGWYVVNATQYSSSTGAPKSGSPGRTTVRVQGAAATSTHPFGATKPTGSGGNGTPDLPLLGILLSASLLAAGLTLVARGRGKKATRPVLGV